MTDDRQLLERAVGGFVPNEAAALARTLALSRRRDRRRRIAAGLVSLVLVVGASLAAWAFLGSRVEQRFGSDLPACVDRGLGRQICVKRTGPPVELAAGEHEGVLWQVSGYEAEVEVIEQERLVRAVPAMCMSSSLDAEVSFACESIVSAQSHYLFGIGRDVFEAARREPQEEGAEDSGIELSGEPVQAAALPGSSGVAWIQLWVPGRTSRIEARIDGVTAKTTVAGPFPRLSTDAKLGLIFVPAGTLEIPEGRGGPAITIVGMASDGSPLWRFPGGEELRTTEG